MTNRYAVLDGPTMPIIGEGEVEPNDTYVEQLTASARAAVEEVVRRGVADPKRVAVGGHSYGARKSTLLFCSVFPGSLTMHPSIPSWIQSPWICSSPPLRWQSP